MNGAGRARFLCLTVAAAGIAVSSFAAESPAAPSSSVFSLLQVVFALLLVLGAIGLFAWALRRFAPGPAGAGGVLRVIGGVMVGPRERLVVVEVQDTWLLLGVASGHVTLVHSMPRPPGETVQPTNTSGFARVLSQMRQGRSETR